MEGHERARNETALLTAGVALTLLGTTMLFYDMMAI